MSGGGRKRGRTQRRHFKQSRENVWKHDSKAASSDGPPSSSPATGGEDSNANSNPSWQPFATKNPNFDEYYKEQRIVSEDEWEDFISVLRKPLPAAFRVNSSGQFFQDILSQLENDFVESLKAEVENDYEIEAIRPLPWYPGKLAWHLNFSRMQLRKNQTLERFHEFLKLENEVGNITRQEAVSMVPPLFLDVLPDHFILDMCAAPGSKTFQLLEMIHQSTKPGQLPDGLVIANDVDVQRCNLLIHQTKRMCTANLVVTNHEAQHFPTCSITKNQTENFEVEKEIRKRVLQFDRVLCDVPCSGDGTLRKAPDIWRKWNAGMGNGLHRLQVEIAMRGINLLKVGGRMVYSTCSMNPVENEAVVAEVLRRTGDSVKLLDVSNELPTLIRRPGLKTWKIKDRGIWLVSYKDVPNYRRSVIIPSMFPSGQNHVNDSKCDDAQECIDAPSSKVEGNASELSTSHPDGENVEHESVHKNLEKHSVESTEAENKLAASSGGSDTDVEVSCFPLEHCMRIVPHDQNTGAFFIAVFQKISSSSVNEKSDISVDLKQSTNNNFSSSSNLDVKHVENSNNIASPKDALDHNYQIATEAVSHADIIVDQSTQLSDDRDVCMTDKDSEEIDLPSIGKNVDAEVDKAKEKLQTHGRWKGIDPVVFFEDELIINSIRSFYGISESFPLEGQLVTRNSDANHVKRIYYISKAVQDALQLNFQVGQRLKIASLGLKIFERQSSKDGSSNCSFRISSEGLPLLLPYLGKQILYASSVDFKHLLQYRVIKFTDFVNSEFREKASSLVSGCCVVVLNEGNGPKEIVVDSSVAIVCWKGKTNLSIMLSPLDGKELLERVSARSGSRDGTLAEQSEDSNLDISAVNYSSSVNVIASELADEKIDL